MYKYLFKSILSILEYILEENVDEQHFTRTIHSSPVGNVPKLGTAQMPNNGSRDKQFRCICMQQRREDDRVYAAVRTNLTHNAVGAMCVRLHKVQTRQSEPVLSEVRVMTAPLCGPRGGLLRAGGFWVSGPGCWSPRAL